MKIYHVIQETSCSKHDAWSGEPCWSLPAGHGRGETIAVCNDRARRAGMTGYISKHAMRVAPSDRKLQATTGGKQQRQPRHKRAA